MRIKSVVLSWFIAVVLFAVCFGVFCARFQAKGQERTEYPVVVFGDSLLGLCRTETAIPVLLEEQLGKPVFNAALGGTCMAVQDGDVATNYSMELLNMVSLAKALEADDFGAQRTVRSRRESTYYFPDTLEELPQIDFHKVQMVVLAFGINDYHAGIPLDTEGRPYDEATYGGALRSVIRSLQGTYPQLRIVLVTPTYSWYRNYKLTCEEYAPRGAVLEEYVAKELEVAEEFGLEAVDLYHDVYPHGEH